MMVIVFHLHEYIINISYKDYNTFAISNHPDPNFKQKICSFKTHFIAVRKWFFNRMHLYKLGKKVKEHVRFFFREYGYIVH